VKYEWMIELLHHSYYAEERLVSHVKWLPKQIIEEIGNRLIGQGTCSYNRWHSHWGLKIN